MKTITLSCICFYSCCVFANFSDHLKKEVGNKEEKSPIQGIDYIYMINLDQRPEKWEACTKQLQPYGIVPHRFPAIYGWDLSREVKNELGLKFSPNMLSDQWVLTLPKKFKGQFQLDFLREELYGTTVFCHWMSSGAIGCYLSHLSVLQDAFDSGYETIWILEDDIAVEKDPQTLSEYIQELDALVGKNGWDVLYTDMDFEAASYLPAVKQFPHFFWRPNLDSSSNYERFMERKTVGDNFLAIGSRSRTHSMIIRRSGMKKILDHAKERHIFLPYDHDIAVVPDIKLFNLRNNVVTVHETTSDTRSGEFSEQTKWDTYRNGVLTESKNIKGWNNLIRASKLMQVVHDIRPSICVEIGCFGGSTSYQIAKTLSFLKKGKLYAIDAWSSETAIEGIKDNSLVQTFKSIDWKAIKTECENLILTKNLSPYCTLIHELSTQAASRFTEENIDFLYVDGNSSTEGSLADVTAYLPKIKKGGYVCLSGDNLLEKSSSIAFLLKHCSWLKEDFSEFECLLFQKK